MTDDCPHEWLPAVIESALWIGIDLAVISTEEARGTIKPVDGNPATFVEGSATFKHMCSLCGTVERWKV